MDTLFHYYGSYLAARLAGMEQDTAQRLAYYCYGMFEQKAGSDTLRDWYVAGVDDGDRAFSPCVVMSNDDSQYGMYNCKLAFTHLPCMSFAFDGADGAAELDFYQGQTVTNAVAAEQHEQAASRFAYNPLTDIDWRGKGEVKPSFGRKIADKLSRLRRHSSYHVSSISSGSSSAKHYFDPRLVSVPNSVFSRQMLNDAIEKKYKPGGVDPLALFACRLFVYQQTWMNAAFNSNSSSSDQNSSSVQKHSDKVQVYLSMFYWTAYAIQSFMAGKSIGDKLRIRLLSDGSKVELLNSLLRSIFVFEGNKLEKEYFYLSRLACILSYGEVKHQPALDNWYQGLRFRPQFLMEKALIASGGCHRQIQFLSAFKQTEFYQLNKAAETHTIWLDEQLQAAGLGELSTAQLFYL